MDFEEIYKEIARATATSVEEVKEEMMQAINMSNYKTDTPDEFIKYMASEIIAEVLIEKSRIESHTT